ncbi:MAG: shikimate dehydrogenase [Maioricimonas sp. JB045]|uniref:shikimate dehydrogenase n=1 Tax=Maioricimonas sp. JC845 TaxID=3232138 RepID=UPI00345996C3
MICVTIGRSRHKMVSAEHRALAEKGAQLVELRVDWIARKPDLGRLLKDRPTPVVVTCRRPQDGGKWRGTDDERMMILRQAIVDGAEYVDLEGDIAGKVPRYGKTRRIVSHHDFERTPDDLEEIHAELCKHDPDVVKIVTMANSPLDNVRMLRLVASAEVPTIGFCMGDMGTVSRVLCGKYGAPFTYASFSSERVMAPGQVSFDEMRKIYHYDDIDSDTLVYGVLGDPIGHSYSPMLHNATFRHEALKAVYLPIRVPAEEIADTLKQFAAIDIRGYSVTIPHKEAAARFANYPDESVKQIGAANTLYCDDRGRWFAANTDYEAALSTIRDALEQRNPNDAKLDGKRVLLLGAGGVSRAIGFALARAGCIVTIANRTKARARELSEQLDCQYVTWENRGSVASDILVNCTPIGMFPNMDETPFPQHWIRDGMLVFDTIYNPENTLLLKEARERDCTVASGLEMFVRQAAAQFECFTKRPAPIEYMRETLRKGLSPVRVKRPE